MAEMSDPSTLDGFRVVYDREVSVEIRHANAENQEEVGQLQPVRAKFVVLGDDATPEAVRFECSSEVDLFFHYYHALDGKGFQDMQTKQKLMVDFSEYANVVVRMLNQCIKHPHTFMAVLYLHQDSGTARLDFVQNMDYKFVELLSLDFVQSPPELTKQHVTFRYTTMKDRVAMLHSQLQKIQQLIKLKNPSLLLQFQKSLGRANTAHSNHAACSSPRSSSPSNSASLPAGPNNLSSKFKY